MYIHCLWSIESWGISPTGCHIFDNLWTDQTFLYRPSPQTSEQLKSGLFWRRFDWQRLGRLTVIWYLGLILLRILHSWRVSRLRRPLSLVDGRFVRVRYSPACLISSNELAKSPKRAVSPIRICWPGPQIYFLYPLLESVRALSVMQPAMTAAWSAGSRQGFVVLLASADRRLSWSIRVASHNNFFVAFALVCFHSPIFSHLEFLKYN